MDGLERHGGLPIVALVVLAGLTVAGLGAARSEPVLFWGGMFLAVIAFVFGRPRDPEAAIDDRAAALE